MKKNRILNTLLSVLMLSFLLVGCADGNDTNTQADAQTSISTEQEQEEPLVSETVTGEESDVTKECPEGYVYDYQVSMEPIPEDIAALGGNCQGTIHAFPSKIGMALTELEMEKDPVLKAEVEKRIPEIEAALEEEIGGEFVLDGVILQDDLLWVFFCTEVETGYQFNLYYANNEYYAAKNNLIVIKNIVDVADYYDEKESIRLREVMLPIVREVYTEGNIKIHMQSEGAVVDIAIAQYSDTNVDKYVEQEKILVLWEKLQSYNDSFDYNLNITFYPHQYSNVIEEKYKSNFYYDSARVYSEEVMTLASKNKEIWCCFNYSFRHDNENTTNLNVLLNEHNNGTCNETTIWEYWIP